MSNRDWIGPKEVRTATESLIGPAESLIETLQDNLKLGLLRARAGVAIFGQGDQIERQTDFEIPTSAWSEPPNVRSRGLEFTLDYMHNPNWHPSNTGLFGARSSHFLELTYSRADLFRIWPLKCFAAAEANPSQHLPQLEEKRGGGRRPSVEGWSRFAAALAVWVHKRDDEPLGIASVGPDELLAELDLIAMNELPKSLAGDLPRGTYQAGAAAALEAFSHLARK